MHLFRIAKSENRAHDISGLGAYRLGGRWNSKGTYMLYTSENSSLAYLENLVHFDPENSPPNLYITNIEVRADSSLIYALPENSYPANWQQLGNYDSKALGDLLMSERNFLAVSVRSAINPFEHNYLLNPLFPGYHELVSIYSIDKLNVDARLV